jgi:hypothetical protein
VVGKELEEELVELKREWELAMNLHKTKEIYEKYTL